jgi:hypothetical protein
VGVMASQSCEVRHASPHELKDGRVNKGAKQMAGLMEPPWGDKSSEHQTVVMVRGAAQTSRQGA